MSEYVPGAPINDEAKKSNENLPGMGGVFNTVNLHLYHYAGNNPVKYVDPDGRTNDNPETSVVEESVIAETPTYIWPIQTGRLTSARGTYDYLRANGQLTQKPHAGIDVSAPAGTPLVSISDGTVRNVYKNVDGYGNSVIMQHADGVTSRYSHMRDTPTLNVGDTVKQGEAVGVVGNTTATGASTGNHLDFEVTVNGAKVDPFSILGPLPSGITPLIREGYVQSDGNGGYQNWLLVPNGFTPGPRDIYNRNK